MQRIPTFTGKSFLSIFFDEGLMLKTTVFLFLNYQIYQSRVQNSQSAL